MRPTGNGEETFPLNPRGKISSFGPGFIGFQFLSRPGPDSDGGGLVTGPSRDPDVRTPHCGRSVPVRHDLFQPAGNCAGDR